MTTDNKIMNFAIGGVVGAVLALALAVVAFDLAQIPRLWAYVFLGLIIIVIAINLLLLIRGDRLMNRFFGVESSDLQTVLDGAAQDVESGNYGQMIKTKVPAMLSSFASFRARLISAFHPTTDIRRKQANDW